MLVFIHINKTAGRTVRYILRSSYGSRHCEVEPWHAPSEGPPFSTSDLRRLRRLYPNLVSIAGHRLAGYVELQEQGTQFRYLTFMRDPLEMCASRFQYQIDYRGKRHLTFEQWIQKDVFRNAQTKRIAGTPSAGDAIRIITGKDMFVGLTERFDESVVLLKGLRADDLDIGYRPINVARSNALANDLLSKAETRQALVEANQADLELYHYVTSELYPSFQQQYGSSLDDAVADYRRSAHPNFNKKNIAEYRLKQHAVYRPLLRLSRGKTTGKVVEKLLA